MPGAGQDPNDREWQERWMARLERRMESLEEEFRKHTERSGHSSEPDLRQRINRLELAILGLLTAAVTEVIRVLTGAGKAG